MNDQQETDSSSKDTADDKALEPIDARLIWQCHRGMLELDLILQGFITCGYQQLSAPQKKLFQALLAHDDPQLLRWLLGYVEPQDPAMAKIVTLVRSSYAAR